ncbi:WXG100 family type VII secretion target [Nocardia bovistercoris]|uniref:WXG100 family type VII secretion target n=1 Tax=Nocardia bovistercoris TaxID=2785916 RepID=A0A931ILG0_9NOCA|nr:WXG100 family type VII secretion target [Nocardia bovistercoris]MBH0781780.1 WXG100 family type VII secretion target [Nocardia bovistercoris]
MTDSFSVDLDRVEQIVARLTALAGFVAEHIDQIDDRAAAILTGTGWEGVAAQAYESLQQQWSVSAREFVDGIHDMSAAAEAAHSSYTDAGAVNTRLFRGK